MKSILVLISLILSVTLIRPINIVASPKNRTPEEQRTYATWLWHTQKIVSNSNEILDFLIENNVKDLYLQIDYDLNVDAYRRFIRKAKGYGIDVHALDGAPEWAGDEGIKLQQTFFNWVSQYQKEAAANEVFRGIHLDIEPYLLQRYKTDKSAVLENYQFVLLNARDRSKGLGLVLSLSVPFWFDEVVYDTKYGKGVMVEWLISQAEHIVIMAYRDQALGSNGIIRLVSEEMQIAKEYDTKLTIAIETHPSDEEEYISFYGKSKQVMKSELSSVYRRYRSNSSFDGFAIHHLGSWMALEE